MSPTQHANALPRADHGGRRGGRARRGIARERDRHGRWDTWGVGGWTLGGDVRPATWGGGAPHHAGDARARRCRGHGPVFLPARHQLRRLRPRVRTPFGAGGAVPRLRAALPRLRGVGGWVGWTGGPRLLRSAAGRLPKPEAVEPRPMLGGWLCDRRRALERASVFRGSRGLTLV